MSLDRIVRWKDKQPTREQIQTVLEDFFTECGEITWNSDRWIVKLPGTATYALTRIADISRPAEFYPSERWLEVWPRPPHHADPCLYVMTRMQDEFVNALAAGLVRVFARYWQGTIQTPEE